MYGKYVFYLIFLYDKYSFMRIIFLLLAIFSSFFTNAQKNTNQEKIRQLATQLEPKLIAWRRDFHAHPELGNREFRTASIIAGHLRSLGMDVDTGVAKTGVVGLLKGSKPGPVVALRADMDGLPVTERTKVEFASKVKTTYNGQETGVMHACGHDSHIAIMMTVAEVLSMMKNELKGSVKFIFQPAEEGPPPGEKGGAELMVKENVLNDPKVDVIFGLHINSLIEAGKIGYRPGGFYASASDMKITIKGKSSHGASPWNGIDPILVSAQVLNNLHTIISRNLDLTTNPGVISIGSIHGGNRSNIIPEQVEMLGTVRAMSDKDEKFLTTRIREVVANTAKAMNAEAKIELPYSYHYPVTANDSSLTLAMLPSLEKAAGKQNVILEAPATVSEDFSYFQQKVPGLFFRLGGMPRGKDPATAADHHTPDFYLDESGFKVGVMAFANLVLDYMNKKP